MQQQEDRLYFYSQTLNAVRDIFRHIFTTLPWFLPETAMLQIEKLEDVLRETKTIHDKLLSPQQSDVQNTTVECLLTKLKQQKNAMADLLKATLRSMEESFQEKHRSIFNKIHRWKTLLKEAEERFTGICQHIDTGDKISDSHRNHYNLLLRNLREQAKSLWSLFQAKLEAIKDKDRHHPPLKEILGPALYPKSIAQLRRLQINRNIVGGGKWLFYPGHPTISLHLAEKLLKKDRIVPLLEQTAKLFERYGDFLLEKQTTRLKEYFGSHYQEALVQQEDQLFLQEWLRILDARRKPILAPTHRGWTFALAAKNLLYSIKNQFYIEFYQRTKQHEAKIIIALAAALQKKDASNHAASLVVQMLVQQQGTLTQNIREITAPLKAYGWTSGVLSAGMRLWGENFYFQWSKRFFMLSNEHTASSNKNASLLQTRLSDATIQVFSTLLSTVLFSTDFYVSKRWGGSYILLMTLPRLLLSDIDTLVHVTDMAQISRSLVIQNIPSLEWVLGFCVLVGFHALTAGLTMEIFAYFAASYLIATACRRLAGMLLDKVTPQRPDIASVPSTGYSFFKSMVHQGGYIGGAYLWKRAYPQIRLFFTTPPDKTSLLNNKRLCSLYPKPCKEVALEVLGLPLDATKSEIKKKWGALMLEIHPDRTGCDTAAEAAELNNAKRILLKN